MTLPTLSNTGIPIRTPLNKKWLVGHHFDRLSAGRPGTSSTRAAIVTENNRLFVVEPTTIDGLLVTIDVQQSKLAGYDFRLGTVLDRYPAIDEPIQGSKVKTIQTLENEFVDEDTAKRYGYEQLVKGSVLAKAEGDLRAVHAHFKDIAVHGLRPGGELRSAKVVRTLTEQVETDIALVEAAAFWIMERNRDIKWFHTPETKASTVHLAHTLDKTLDDREARNAIVTRLVSVLDTFVATGNEPAYLMGTASINTLARVTADLEHDNFKVFAQMDIPTMQVSSEISI